MPSSIGMSILVTPTTQMLKVIVRWGDYRLEVPKEGQGGLGGWKRTAHEEVVRLELPEGLQQPQETAVPNSAGLKLALSVRPVNTDGEEGGLRPGTRSVSVFLVNRRRPAPDETRDEAFAFQTQLEVGSAEPLVPRPNLRSLMSSDSDERVADLQYRDACEFAVGHSVATEAVIDECICRHVRTCWIPEAEVERVAPAPINGVELSMDALAQLASVEDARAKLGSFVDQYRQWINRQRATMPSSPARRRETAEELLRLAGIAADRIERGIALLADPKCLDAFKIANRAMATAARRRLGVMQGKDPATVQSAWRPFQLAFLLMNLPGIAEPMHADRAVVDLLFFPTGGGKTEAYLGLAAFTLVLRRLENPGIGSAGLSVLMRYTLRLLTLDQLGRAASVLPASVCERFSAAWYRGLSGHELVEDSPWVREKHAPCLPVWRKSVGNSSIGGRFVRSPHASRDRCGRRRQGSPTRAGFPVPPRRCGSTITHSNSTSPRRLRPGGSLKSTRPNNADHGSMVPGRRPPFSNWRLPRELPLANGCWSWRMPPGRKCGSMSEVLRHPT
jgi:hypothetical protein